MNHDPYDWNESLKGNFLWSNVNFGEAVTQAMTPLSWSVIQFTLQDWVYIAGLPTIGNIGGFPYVNISVFVSLFRALGRSRQELQDELEATLYMELPEDRHLPSLPISRTRLYGSLWNALQVQARQYLGVRRTPGYLKHNLVWFRQMRQQIAETESGEALKALFRHQIAPAILHGVWCTLGSALYSANDTISLRRDLTRLVGSDDANSLIANLDTPQSALRSLGPVQGLARVAAGEIMLANYLEEFGHRGPDEFELSEPRPAENPHWVKQQIDLMRRAPVDVSALLQRQNQAYQSAWQRLEQGYPHQAAQFRRRIAESARRARLREETRSAYVRDRWALRLFALRAGELSGLGEDIFYLTLQELLGLLAGEKDPLRFIQGRKDLLARYRSLPPYPSTVVGQFDPLDGEGALAGSGSAAGPAPRSRLLTGSPGSTGCVEGSVRLLENPAAGDYLQPGEILVAYQTDISWTLLFPRAAAVITEVGAPLSHAAIVARELGIPAVVGCQHATHRLRTGDRVRVDGGRGTVEILK